MSKNENTKIENDSLNKRINIIANYCVILETNNNATLYESKKVKSGKNVGEETLSTIGYYNNSECGFKSLFKRLHSELVKRKLKSISTMIEYYEVFKEVSSELNSIIKELSEKGLIPIKDVKGE